jgi:hypothetical protein
LKELLAGNEALDIPACSSSKVTFIIVAMNKAHFTLLTIESADSIRQFCSTHWARVHRATRAQLVVPGYGTELLRDEITDATVQVLGMQQDLRPLYERARVFVVATRYAAGLPFKACEAAGFGVPMVVSPLIDRQMRWRDGAEYWPPVIQIGWQTIVLGSMGTKSSGGVFGPIAWRG